MNDNGRISFSVVLDNSQLQRDAQRSRALLQGIGDTAREEGKSIDEVFSKIGKTIAGAFTVQKATEFIQRVITTRKEIQALELSFTALLGSKEKADKLFGNLRQFAATTTFSIGDLAKGAQTLLGFNVAAEKVETILHAIGDISMGDAQKFQSLTLAFAQMSSTGKLMGQDLLQMINAGFNPLATISEKTGKSISELKDEMSKGTLSAELITQAFIDATSEGGKFYNMLATQSEGIAGRMAKLSGTIEDAFNDIGERSEGIITGGIQMLQVLAENYEKVGRVIAELVATYGVYKAALMTLNALEVLRYQATLAHMAGLTKMGAVMVVLREKTIALNNAIMKNPYVLAAAGVATLGLAIYKLATYQTDAEKAMKKLNDATDEMNSSLAAERAKVDILFARLKAAKQGTTEYEKAKAAIISQYGDYLKGLSDEVRNLTDISAAYAAITTEATKAAKARAMASFTEQAATDYGKVEAGARSDLHKALEKKYSGQTDSDGVALAEVYFQKLIPVLEGKIQADEELAKVISSFNAEAYSGGGMFGGGSSFTVNTVQGILDKVQKTRDVMNNTMKEARVRFGDFETKEAEAEPSKTDRSSSLPNDKGSDNTADEIAQRKAKIAEYAKKVSAAVAQAELDIRQAELGAMEESYEKSKAQIALNYDRLILENEKRREEMIEALKDNMTNEWLNTNPNATKEQEVNYRASLNVGTEDLSKGQQDALAGYEIAAARDYTKAIEDLNKKRLENERASIQEYLKEYGEYEDKRVALRQEAEDKIAKIRANGNLTDTDKEYQIKGIEEGLEQSLKDLDLEKLKKDMDWDTVFGNIDNLPLEVLSVAREQLEQFRDAANDLNPEQIKVITEALEQLKERSDLSRPVQSIKNAVAAYKTAKKEFQAAAKTYKAAQKAGDTKAMEAENKKMIKSSKEMAEAAQTERDAYKVLSEAIEEYAGFLKEAGDAIGGTVGEMLNFSAAALSCGNSMVAGVQAFKKSVSALEKASAILAIISAAFQLIQGIVSLFGGKEDTTLKTYVEAMDNYISLLGESISDLNDAMMDTKNTIAETVDTYKQLVKLEEDQAEAIKSQDRVRLNSGASRKSHSEGYKAAKEITDGMDSSDKETRAFYSSAFNKLDQYKRKATNGKEGAYQSGLGRLDWLWDLSDDELRSIANDPKLLAALGETGEAIVKYVQALDAKQELEDALNEAILGVSWDNFYDDFVEMISDMDVTSEEFADNFTEYMRNALIKEMVNSQFKSRLEKIYKQAAEYMEAGTLDDHIDELKDDWTKAGEEARKQVELINQITGYETEASREASQKGIATASQESVDENNARLTTIQGHTYMLAQNSGENKVYLMAASEHLKAIREIASTGLQHLTDISRNTYQLYETNQRLKRVEEDLSGINTKGVIIRNV